jgi:hypothetical protein
VSRLISARTAPVWLPLLAFARDFLGIQYIFFHEPGITQHDVKVGYMFMLPGSLVGVGFFTTIAANMVLALGIGLICWSYSRRRPKNIRHSG